MTSPESGLKEKLLSAARETAPLTSLDLFGDRLWGLHASRIIGAGYDFHSHKPFEEGDDPRFFDSRVYERTGERLIKQFPEERQLRIVIAVDTTATMFSGTKTFLGGGKTKLHAAFLLAASLTRGFTKEGDAIGFFLAGKTIEYFAPRRSNAAEEGLSALWERSEKNGGGEASFLAGLSELVINQTKPAIVFIISDFSETFMPEKMATLAQVMKDMDSEHHIPVALVTRTPWEYAVPDIRARVDFEGGFRLNLGSRAERAIYAEVVRENRTALRTFFDSGEVRHLFLRTEDSLLSDLAYLQE